MPRVGVLEDGGRIGIGSVVARERENGGFHA